MPVTLRSFAKINIGLCIGPKRDDGFHPLRTTYQTIGLHDTIRLQVFPGTGIEIRCKDSRVPTDETNTCWRVAEKALRTLKTQAKVVITIEKGLPVQGGLGAASSNAIATLFALERELKTRLSSEDRLSIAAEVGSDLPLFLIGGLVLGLGRGEEVFPLADMPELPLVVATPAVAVSTPQAFSDWDKQFGAADVNNTIIPKLTSPPPSATIDGFSRAAFSWLSSTSTGVPVLDGNRAETLLLDLVRAGIENDFESVVFSQHPELRDVKRVLEQQGAKYASLSGSGSAIYGIFESQAAAQKAAAALSSTGTPAQATMTLPRTKYWESLVVE